jgi:hypothetical protein
LRAIIKQAGLSVEEFLKLLRDWKIKFYIVLKIS